MLIYCYPHEQTSAKFEWKYWILSNYILYMVTLHGWWFNDFIRNLWWNWLYWLQQICRRIRDNFHACLCWDWISIICSRLCKDNDWQVNLISSKVRGSERAKPLLAIAVITRMWNMISSPVTPTVCLEQKSENFQSRNMTFLMPSQSKK